jgi:hypothetical protein
MPFMDVPSGVRGVGTIHDDHVLFSYMIPFEAKEMKARYGSHEAYVDLIRAGAVRMVGDRLIRADAADDVIALAERVSAF